MTQERNTRYHVTASINRDAKPSLPILVNLGKEKEDLRKEIADYTPKEMVENIKKFRKGCKAGVVSASDVMYKLDRIGKIQMISKYSDVILALPKEPLQIWVSGASWSPIDYVNGEIDETDQKRMIKYLDSDKCRLSDSKAKRLRRHMGLSYREIKYVR